MTAESIPYPTVPPSGASGRLAAIFAKETKYEFLKLLRAKSFSLATIGFPVMFYTLFGIANHRIVHGDVRISKYMLGGYACFGLIGAALFGIGVGMASEIHAGWLEVKRASPMPPMAYLAAKCATAIAFGWIIVTILIVLGVAFAHVSISPSEAARMLALSTAGSLSFASMGLLLAQLVPASAAPGIVNVIYLPMSFVSGLWVPLSELPRGVQRIAPFFPTYHMSQLMLGVFGRGYTDGSSAAGHAAALVLFTGIMLAASWAVFNRKQQQA